MFKVYNKTLVSVEILLVCVPDKRGTHYEELKHSMLLWMTNFRRNSNTSETKEALSDPIITVQ